MQTAAALPALETRSTARKQPQPDWIRAFVLSAGAVLLAAALNRFLIAAGNAQVLALPEPMLGIPLRDAVLAVGVIELPVALFCLLGKQCGLQLAALAWLSTIFAVWWIVLLWQRFPLQTACTGSLTDPLHLHYGIMRYLFERLPLFLVLGSYAACFWYWLSPAARSAQQLAVRQQAEQRDAAAGLLKMLCPACGGHVKFPAQNIGQEIACPHCQAAITLCKPDENLKMHCVLCGGHLEFPPHAIGQKIPCPHCAKTITLLKSA